MKTLAEIQSEIDKLNKAKIALEKDEAKRRNDLVKSVEVSWEWRVKWLNSHTVYVEKRWDDITRKEFEAIGTKPSSLSDWTCFNGMKYVLTCSGHLLQFGGGHLVLDIDQGVWGNREEGRLLTSDEVLSLRACKVPETLMKRS